MKEKLLSNLSVYNLVSNIVEEQIECSFTAKTEDLRFVFNSRVEDEEIEFDIEVFVSDNKIAFVSELEKLSVFNSDSIVCIEYSDGEKRYPKKEMNNRINELEKGCEIWI